MSPQGVGGAIFYACFPHNHAPRFTRAILDFQKFDANPVRKWTYTYVEPRFTPRPPREHYGPPPSGIALKSPFGACLRPFFGVFSCTIDASHPSQNRHGSGVSCSRYRVYINQLARIRVGVRPCFPVGF